MPRCFVAVSLAVFFAACGGPLPMPPADEPPPASKPPQSSPEPKPEPCKAAPIASGSVKTSVTPITVRPNAVVTSSLKHKLDIDPVEDGCVTTFDFDIRLHPQGCDLKARFTTSGDNVAHLSYLGLHADSFCENFLDPQEGDYSVFRQGTLSQPDVAIWVGGLAKEVPGDQQKSACLAAQTVTFPDVDIRMIRSGDTADQALIINLKDFVLTGDFKSAGDVNEHCPAKVGCPSPNHDGGNRTCYGSTNCAAGFTYASGVCAK